MKLLFTATKLTNAGNERVLSLITNELVNRGHDVFIGTDVKESFCQYHFDERIKFIDLYAGWKKTTPLNNWFIILKNCKKAVIENNIDVVATLNRMKLPQWTWLKLKYKIKIIGWEHTTYNDHYYKHHNKINNCLLNWIDKVAILTHYDLGYLRRRNSKNKIVMINPHSFEPITQEEYDIIFNEKKHILACGSIYPLKGFDFLIKSFARIKDDFPDWYINIAGTGSEAYTQSLKQLVVEYGLDGRVNFLGQRSDIQELMKQHSLFVMSSRQEGLPMVLIEALACGTPCISFDLITGPSEIIVDSIDGILVENQNISQLAEGMKELMSDTNRRYIMGKNALVNVKRFSVSRVADKWERLFEELMEEKMK